MPAINALHRVALSRHAHACTSKPSIRCCRMHRPQNRRHCRWITCSRTGLGKLASQHTHPSRTLAARSTLRRHTFPSTPWPHSGACRHGSVPCMTAYPSGRGEGGAKVSGAAAAAAPRSPPPAVLPAVGGSRAAVPAGRRDAHMAWRCPHDSHTAAASQPARFKRDHQPRCPSPPTSLAGSSIPWPGNSQACLDYAPPIPAW